MPSALALLLLFAQVISIGGHRKVFTPVVTGGSCPFTDSFSGSGPLSGSWTSVSAAYGGSGTIIQTGGHAQADTIGNKPVALVTGGGCTFPADQYAQVSVTEAEGKVMAMVRADASGNAYGLYIQTSGILILSLTNGAGNVIGGTSCTYGNGNTYKISITGPNITVFQNGTSCGSTTDSTFTTGVPGLFIDNSGAASAVNTVATNFQAD